MGIPNGDYGFGLEMMGNVVGHSGGIIGCNSMVLRDGIRKITIITHTNSFDGLPAGHASQEFAKVLGY